MIIESHLSSHISKLEHECSTDHTLIETNKIVLLTRVEIKVILLTRARIKSIQTNQIQTQIKFQEIVFLLATASSNHTRASNVKTYDPCRCRGGTPASRFWIPLVLIALYLLSAWCCAENAPSQYCASCECLIPWLHPWASCRRE